MAATVVDLGSHAVGGAHMRHFKVTADAATAAITVGLPNEILGLSFPFKTTGSASALTAVLVAATGVVTVAGLTGTDVFYITAITA